MADERGRRMKVHELIGKRRSELRDEPEVTVFREAGGSVLIAVTPVGVGRNPAGLRRLAEASDLQIVMGAGRYREPAFPREVFELGTNRLAIGGLDGPADRAPGAAREGVTCSSW